MKKVQNLHSCLKYIAMVKEETVDGLAGREGVKLIMERSGQSGGGCSVRTLCG